MQHLFTMYVDLHYNYIKMATAINEITNKCSHTFGHYDNNTAGRSHLSGMFYEWSCRSQLVTGWFPWHATNFIVQPRVMGGGETNIGKVGFRKYTQTKHTVHYI